MKYILAIFLPPLAVLFEGNFGAFLLNLLLTLFFWFPGVIHAVLVINENNTRRATEKVLADNKRTREVVERHAREADPHPHPLP